MPGKRHSEEQILYALRPVEAGKKASGSLSGDGGVAAGGVQLEAAIRGTGIERITGTPAIAEREPQAERDRGGPHVGQTHFAGSALKKGLKPAKRRELVRQVRQAYQLSESVLAGLCASLVGRIVTRAVAIPRPSYASGCGIWPARGSGTVSKTDGDAAARRLARKYKTRLPAVSRGSAASTDEGADQECGASANHASRSHFCEPALEHGLYERATGGRTMVPNTDDIGPVHQGMFMCVCGPFADGREGPALSRVAR